MYAILMSHCFYFLSYTFILIIPYIPIMCYKYNGNEKMVIKHSTLSFQIIVCR